MVTLFSGVEVIVEREKVKEWEGVIEKVKKCAWVLIIERFYKIKK